LKIHYTMVDQLIHSLLKFTRVAERWYEGKIGRPAKYKEWPEHGRPYHSVNMMAFQSTTRFVVLQKW